MFQIILMFLGLQSTVVTICTICLNINPCTLPTGFIYVFSMILRINNDYFPEQVQLFVPCNGYAVFSVRQTMNF